MKRLKGNNEKIAQLLMKHGQKLSEEDAEGN